MAGVFRLLAPLMVWFIQLLVSFSPGWRLPHFKVYISSLTQRSVSRRWWLPDQFSLSGSYFFLFSLSVRW